MTETPETDTLATDSGLAGLDAQIEDALEQAEPANDAPINLAYDPPSPADNRQATPEMLAAALEAANAQAQAAQGAQVPEEQEKSDPKLNAREQADAEHAQATRARIDEFTQRVRQANRSEAPIHVPSPLPERIAAQTQAEMAAGQKLNEHFANLQHTAPKRKIIHNPKLGLRTEGTSTPVFRPADYVPDQKKGQGNVGARPVT